MRKNILFHIGFLLVYKSVYALPLIAAVPFIFDIAILAYTAFSICFFGVFAWILRYIRLLLLLMFWISIAVFTALWYFAGKYQLFIITLDIHSVQINYMYFTYATAILLFLGSLVYYNKKLSFLLFLSLSTFIIVSIPLLYSTLYNKTVYEKTLEQVQLTYPEMAFKPQSKMILNNIFVAQDINYMQDWEFQICRITLSYYFNTSWIPYSAKGVKTDNLQIYTGLDDGTCREIFTPIYTQNL